MIAKLTINGEQYPCYATLGAMLRFKQETGREVSNIPEDSLSDLATYMWCCVRSACKVEGKTFDMNLIDFADSLSPDSLMTWANAIQEGVDEKKKVKKPKK